MPLGTHLEQHHRTAKLCHAAASPPGGATGTARGSTRLRSCVSSSEVQCCCVLLRKEQKHVYSIDIAQVVSAGRMKLPE